MPRAQVFPEPAQHSLHPVLAVLVGTSGRMGLPPRAYGVRFAEFCAIISSRSANPSHRPAPSMGACPTCLPVLACTQIWVASFQGPHAVGCPACLARVLTGHPNGANGYTMGPAPLACPPQEGTQNGHEVAPAPLVPRSGKPWGFTVSGFDSSIITAQRY